MRSVFTIVCFLAFSAGLGAEILPEWMIPLRDAVYEQTLSVNGFDSVYQAAKTTAKENYTGIELDLALSRCEYLMGRFLQDLELDDEARVHFFEGMRLAEKVLQEAPGAEPWVLRTMSLAQACSLGPWTYTIRNGLDVERFAKRALSFDKENVDAIYHIASRWVYAPVPFNNLRRGIEMMQSLLGNSGMQKDNFFNVYVSIGFAYVRQRKYDEARPWLLRAQEIYPSNKFVTELLGKRKTSYHKNLQD